MSITLISSRIKSQQRHRNHWWERFSALIVLSNFLLVLFDLSYIPLRDFWLQGKIRLLEIPIAENEFFLLTIPLPNITNLYDPVKGIEPHIFTVSYLQTVDLINSSLENPDLETQLQQLRNLSVTMIDSNPFEIANKTGSLEKIKNKIRLQIFGKKNLSLSAKQAFEEFWSSSYLAEDTETKLKFFNTEIRPLMENNYYRPRGENGLPVDRFALIDLPFMVIFAIEFLLRTRYISRHRSDVSWWDAVFWRWYDLFLLLPVWRWLRVITTIIRLHQARLINLGSIQRQISRGFVASIAEDLTEVVVVRVINQMQDSIRRGDISSFLAQSATKPYIDLNNTNEIAELAKLMAQMTVYQVMPQIRPDIETLLQHNLGKVIKQIPAYQGLQLVPGMEQLQKNLAKQVTREIYQVVYQSLNNVLEEDPVNDKLIEQLISNLTEALGSQIQAQDTLEKVQYLLDAMLEEIKINYVKRLSSQDVEAIMEATRAIHQRTSRAN